MLERFFRTRFGVPLMAVVALAATALMASASSVSADEQSQCASFAQPKCSIRLSTGITMRYLRVGPVHGPAVFLLHGYTDSALSWERMLPALHAFMPEADIIVPDLRGHGDTSMPSEGTCAAIPESCFQWKQFAADIVAFMDARHIAKAAIVAHSAGTLVAQELGLSYPRRVGRLVLISTAAAGQEPAVEGLLSGVVEGEWRNDFTGQGYTWPDSVYDLTPAVTVPDFAAFVDDGWVTSSVAPTWFLERLRAAATTIRLGTWIGPLKNIAAADNTQRLRQLTVPTLVLYAVQDDIFSPADERVLIGSLQTAASRGGSFWWKQYGRLPPPASGQQTDLGHNLPWEAPVAVATDVAAFLRHGEPTRTLYHTDYPSDIHRVVGEPGGAVIIHATAH